MRPTSKMKIITIVFPILLTISPSKCSPIPQFIQAADVFSNTLVINRKNIVQQQQQPIQVPNNKTSQNDSNVLKELSQHFTALNEERVEWLSSVLQRMKRLAHNQEYGNRIFTHDNDNDRMKNVSISPTHPSTNPSIAPFLFEGDILLNEKQANSILSHLENRSTTRTNKRSLSADPQAIWHKMPIRFRIHETLEFFAIQQIVEAISFWKNYTCVRFEHIEEPVESVSGDYIEFFKGQGCYSMIGKYGGCQGVSIGAGCERVGIVEHEIGHVLGLWHEQSRPDADKFVHVEKEFVLPSYMSDFQLRGNDEIITLGVPYDYGSVMHYGPTAFSIDGVSVTLRAKNLLFQSTIGQRDKPSFYDVEIINKAYCSDKCGGITSLMHRTTSPAAQGFRFATLPSAKLFGQAECLNGGYPNPTHCSDCLCPAGYGGANCGTYQLPKKTECGAEVWADFSSYNQIQSLGYGAEGYTEGESCSWIIRSPAGSRIKVEFVGEFSLFCSTICVDYVEVKLAEDQRLTGARFCCDQKPNGILVSETNQIAVIFQSQVSQDIGFRLRVKATRLPPTNSQTGRTETNNNSTPIPTTLSTTMATSTITGKNIWDNWGAWSQCSRPCGGCGIRSRVRMCLTAECEGKSQEFGACNFPACPVQANCTKVLYLNRLCSDAFARGTNSAAVCSNVAPHFAECNRPTCCPPFYPDETGICVTNKIVLN